MKRFLSMVSDIKNAMRVLRIMDKCGCDIEFVEEASSWRISPKWYVSKRDAEDLRKIVLYNQHYCKRSRLWNVVFHNVREGYRFPR